MTRERLERNQVWVYLAAIAAGAVVGSRAPGAAAAFEALLWPTLVALLIASFTQTPLNELPAAARDGRFLAASLVGNFVAVPLLVWALLALTPDDPAIRLGVLLVLLAPCTDWFITFAQLGGGDGRRALATTPVNLLAQIALLPVYLWLFMGDALGPVVSAGRFVLVFAALIVAPLAVAFVLEVWAARSPRRQAAVARIGWLPVPLLAVVVFLIAAGQSGIVASAWPVAADVGPAFVLYLAGAAALGVGLGRLFALPVAATRTLIFGLATRNSFVVLPFAMALPEAWRVAVVVIVLQSLVELLGMIVLVRLAPGFLAPDRA